MQLSDDEFIDGNSNVGITMESNDGNPYQRESMSQQNDPADSAAFE